MNTRISSILSFFNRNRDTADQNSRANEALRQGRTNDLLYNVLGAFRHSPDLVAFLPIIHERFAETMQTPAIMDLPLNDDVFSEDAIWCVRGETLALSNPDVLRLERPRDPKNPDAGNEVVDLNALDMAYPYIIEKILFMMRPENVPMLVSDPAGAVTHMEARISQIYAPSPLNTAVERQGIRTGHFAAPGCRA